MDLKNIGSNMQIQVAVVEWEEQEKSVVLYITEMGKLVLMSVESARSLAFALMEAADNMEPPTGLCTEDKK